jgi:hypothetical protein
MRAYRTSLHRACRDRSGCFPPIRVDNRIECRTICNGLHLRLMKIFLPGVTASDAETERRRGRAKAVQVRSGRTRTFGAVGEAAARRPPGGGAPAEVWGACVQRVTLRPPRAARRPRPRTYALTTLRISASPRLCVIPADTRAPGARPGARSARRRLRRRGRARSGDGTRGWRSRPTRRPSTARDPSCGATTRPPVRVG